jgi:hypothetical protein
MVDLIVWTESCGKGVGEFILPFVPTLLIYTHVTHLDQSSISTMHTIGESWTV